MRNRSFFTPLGRMDDVRQLPDADLYAYTMGRGVTDDVKVTRYASRKALESFCKAGSEHYAVVKRAVAHTMLTNRNTQEPYNG